MKKFMDEYNLSKYMLCPFHDDKNPSLRIYEKDTCWDYFCFGCRKYGSVVDLASHINNIPVIDIVNKYKLKTLYSGSGGNTDFQKMMLVCKFTAENFKSKDGNAFEVLQYLRVTRGMRDSDIRDYNLGYLDINNYHTSGANKYFPDFNNPFLVIPSNNKTCDYIQIRSILSKEYRFPKNIPRKPITLKVVENHILTLCEGFFDAVAINKTKRESIIKCVSSSSEIKDVIDHFRHNYKGIEQPIIRLMFDLDFHGRTLKYEALQIIFSAEYKNEDVFILAGRYTDPDEFYRHNAELNLNSIFDYIDTYTRFWCLERVNTSGREFILEFILEKIKEVE